MYQCIGQHRVKLHESDRSRLIRCANISETPSNPDRPEWGWLCSNCSGAPPVPNSPRAEEFNASAAQNDVFEYKDQIESGVMAGIIGSFRGEGDE
jgi:hypothetical protein